MFLGKLSSLGTHSLFALASLGGQGPSRLEFPKALITTPLLFFFLSPPPFRARVRACVGLENPWTLSVLELEVSGWAGENERPQTCLVRLPYLPVGLGMWRGKPPLPGRLIYNSGALLGVLWGAMKESSYMSCVSALQGSFSCLSVDTQR